MGGRPSPDLTGQRFTRLTIVRRIRRRSSPRLVWLVRCDCGQKRYVPTNRLTTGQQKSCGCLRAERMRQHHATYGNRIVNGRKQCTGCKRRKLIKLFGRCSVTRSGYASRCRACRQRARLQRLYGLDSAAVNTMLRRQARRCGVCRARTKLHVDHNHATGRVRGLLCGNCNRALGLLAEDPIRILALIQYIAADRKEVTTNRQPQRRPPPRRARNPPPRRRPSLPPRRARRPPPRRRRSSRQGLYPTG